MEKKMNIVFANRSYGDEVYIAVAFHGGFTTRNFIVNGSEEYIGNCAFANVLSNYWRLTCRYENMSYDVLRNISFIARKGKTDNLAKELSEIFSILYNYEYDEEIFGVAKSNTRNAFENQYKRSRFRARYKSYEFSELNKKFLLRNLIDDIQNIDYKKFMDCARHLLVPGNTYVYIMGQLHDKEQSIAESLIPCIPKIDATVKVQGYGYDPYLREDAHLIRPARNDCNVCVLAYDFINQQSDTYARKLILDIDSERVSGAHEMEISVDRYDASIIFETESLKDEKIDMQQITPDEFESTKKNVCDRYVVMLEKYPEMFVMEAARMMADEMDIGKYIQFLEACTYERYKEIVEAVDVKVTQSQVIMRKMEG